MLKLILSLLYVSLCVQHSSALEPDFFRREKEIKKERAQRAKGASSYTKKRKREIEKKEIEAARYRVVRLKDERRQRKQDAKFEAEILATEKVNSSKLKQAQKYARKKRMHKNEDWKTQNLEFGIEMQKPNLIKEKK